MPGRKDRKMKSRRESILLKNKYEKLLKILWKNIEIKDCPVLWPPSRPEDFDLSAYKAWDSRKYSTPRGVPDLNDRLNK